MLSETVVLPVEDDVDAAVVLPVEDDVDAAVCKHPSFPHSPHMLHSSAYSS